MIRITRARFNIFCGIASVLLAAGSLWFGTRGLCPESGPYVVAFWVLVPPIFFWIDWVWFSSELNSPTKREFAKHTHDLARNIWIAFAGILAYLFGGIHFGIGGA